MLVGYILGQLAGAQVIKFGHDLSSDSRAHPAIKKVQRSGRKCPSWIWWDDKGSGGRLDRFSDKNQLNENREIFGVWAQGIWHIFQLPVINISPFQHERSTVYTVHHDYPCCKSTIRVCTCGECLLALPRNRCMVTWSMARKWVRNWNKTTRESLTLWK